ncbi:M16 family metallopeptidase [Tenacibaculum jejuense]|uniref:Peptidase M16 domain protein n=1 Tax=Tenacibaculum jejuense TaxID=584609 RepID=A0A238U926_9FLAO|nr:insulinase family protein [Tenacibaculum jejuense]SNR15555.1 Peptidase M16 domain protein [Tenacibaculum jejuense]
MKKVVKLFTLVLFVSQIVVAQSTKIPNDPSVKTGKLSNGLTYFVKQNAKPANKVELRLAIKAGSVLEDEDQLGLAHFMEHMNFNGTKDFKRNELVDYLQSIGVKFGSHLNAYTGFDQTVYILPIPTDDPAKLDKGFQIIENWAHGALLEGKDIDEERGVVLEEYRSRRDANSRMLENYIDKIAYGSKYAKRLPIGTKENIENFKHESIRRFFKDWYRPDLMAVIAVGDADVTVLEEKIKKYFSKIPAVKNPRKKESYTLKNHKETFIAIEADKEAPFSSVEIMYKDREDRKPVTTVDGYRKSLINNLFDQMINNRFDELVNSENPPFTYGFSYYGGTLAKDRGAFQSQAGTSAEGQLKGLEALLTENERVKRFGFQKGEFERAKKNIVSRIEKSFKDRNKRESSRITGALVSGFLDNRPVASVEWSYETTLKMLPSIQLSEVNNLIKNYLHDDNRVVVITGPKKTVTEAQVLKALNDVKTKELKPYEDKAVASSLITKVPTAGTVTKTMTNDKLGSKTIVLSNGAKITFKKTDFKNDEILFSAFSYGGTSLYTNEELKATSFANGGLTEAGINGFNLNDMSKMMSGKIARVRPYIGSISEGFSGSASPKYLEELFQQVHLYFTALNKDEKAFKSFVNKQKSFLGNVLASPRFFFQKEMGDFMNEGNPRYNGFPSPEKYEAADYNLAYKKYQERFADASDFNFYFVGNVDENKLTELAKKYIASLPSTNSKESYKVHDFRPKTGSHKKVVSKGKDPKSTVSIRYQGEADYNEKDALVFDFIGEVVGIKLTEKLREKESGVYSAGARSGMSKLPYGRYSFSIGFPCAPENVDKLKDISIAEVESLIKNGPSVEDLEKAKKGMINDHKDNIKKNRFWLNTLQGIDYSNSNPDDVFTFEERVNAVTAKDIQKLAKKYLSSGPILGILNPEK